MSIEELKRENEALKATNLKLQNQVKEMERQFKLMKSIFDNLSEGVVATNLEGEFLLANPSAQEISGMGPLQGSPEEWSETYPTFYPDTVTVVPSTELPLYKAMQGKITDDIKLFLRNQDTSEGVFISVSGRPLFDETENLIGGVIAMRDITELEKLTEQLETTVNELQIQNALMDAIFNSMSDGIVVADKYGKYVMFNETAKKVAGSNLKDISIKQGPETFGLFHPESHELYPIDELPLTRALRGESSDDIEMFIRNSHQSYGMDASISARPIYDESGALRGGVSIIRDISDRKASESQLIVMNDQLTAQSQLLQSIFNSMSDGVFVVDETGRIIFANPSAEQIADTVDFRVEFDDWAKKYSFFYPDKVTPFPIDEMPIAMAIRGETSDNIEIFVHDGRMEGIHVSVSGRPLQDSDGNHTGGVIVFRDVTDKVETEEALSRAFVQGRLEIVHTILHNIGNAINSVSVGIDTIHHQLMGDRLTPRLNALANAIEQHQDNFGDYVKNDPQGQKVLPFILTLAEDFNVVKQQWKETVHRIRNRTRHIVDIIRTQDSYHGMSMTHKDVNLAAAISDVIKILKDSLVKRLVQIEIDCDNAPEEIWIQENLFHQMLINLIKNSIEAIDESVEAGELKDVPCIQVRCCVEDDFLCIDIIDNGIGIDPQDLNKIFSAGFTTKEGGSGLGLHSSANFAISSGGKIQAFSEGKGKGATIRLMLRRSSIQRKPRPTN